MSRLRKFRSRYIGWLFVIPGLALYTIVVVGPSAATVGYALFDWSGLDQPRWIGLKNFIDIVLRDWVFRIALANNIKYVIIFLTVPMVLGVTLAYIATLIRRGRMVYQTIFFLPVVIASVVTCRIWQWIYHPFFGMTGAATEVSWLQWLAEFNLGNPDYVLYAVAFADLWHWWGFAFIVYYGALRQIDVQLYEAARVEGAGTWQLFTKISLPLLRPTIVFLYLLHMIWSFMAFDYVYIMTRGGPGHASELATTWIYDQAFIQFEAGYACALAIYLTLICMIFVAFYLYLKHRGWESF